MPSLSAGAFSSRMGISSRICAPQTSPSALLAGIKIPAVRVPNRPRAERCVHRLLILCGERLAPVDDEQRKIRFLRGGKAPLHAHALDLIVRFPDARRVEQPQQMPPQPDGLLHGVARRARNVGDDRVLEN